MTTQTLARNDLPTDPENPTDAREAVTRTVSVLIQRLAHHGDWPLPSYESAGAAGMDLRAAVPAGEPVVLAPGARALIPTGLAIALPAGFEAQIRPRSGLALKHGITCLNSPGTVDCDYRGEIAIILINHGDRAFTIGRGDRIAQMVIAPVWHAHFREADDLPDSVRGRGGFGSTGV